MPRQRCPGERRHAAQEMASSSGEQLADTRAIARVLYAALTGYWPGQQETALPPAPRRDGRPYRPRQVRAGVPARIDEITCRALFEPLPRDPLPITSPGQLAEAAAPRAALRIAAARQFGRPAGATFIDGMDGTAAAESAGGFEASVIGHPAPRPRRRVRTLAAGGVVGALFFIDSALIGISIIGAAHAPHIVRPIAHAQRPARGAHRRPPGCSSRSATRRSILTARERTRTTSSHPRRSTATPARPGAPSGTRRRYFGNLKPGTGLVVDMGRLGDDH